ncbi:beta-amyrin synthase-like [Chenopodium quinoa]|uniref:beta-amyrin synthase-like n=1 Tax=Chenopodium quinoa TaxID=63459 RepID=UPI000B788567|nr:beta-amyrin synthase-like [Chenopodium quinoa]
MFGIELIHVVSFCLVTQYLITYKMWRLKIAQGTNEPYLYSTNNFMGRQTWEFDPNYGTPEEREEVEKIRSNFYEKRFQIKACGDLIWRHQFLREKNFKQTIPQVKVEDGEEITLEAASTTMKRAARYLIALQAEDGHWPADTAFPLFHIPPLVFCLYVTGHLNSIISAQHRTEIFRTIYNHQNEDGGWGFHCEGPSTMFCTVLNYICLRMLGVGPDEGDHNACPRARKWILDHGSATLIPSWGKTWLCILGLYDWSGCNPMQPELFLLPTFLPMHKVKMWCYTRMVLMPMSYLYGKRFVGPITPLIKQLKKELYNEPFDQISWRKARHSCAAEDLFYPHQLIQDLIWDTLHYFVEPFFTRWPLNQLVRKRALEVTMKHIHYEDEDSNYITLACVEKVLCMLACWVENPEGDDFKKHLARISDYIWISEDGLKVQGIGSQQWDCGLSVQALLASNLGLDEIGPALNKAHFYIKESQIKKNPSGDFKSMYRHISKGAWGFSAPDHGWQVSDCTAEALKCCLILSTMPPEIVGEKMDTKHIFDSVNFLLSLQSKNGGLTAWEPARGYKWLEVINSTDFFANVIVEHEYVECTSSVIQALVLFKKLYPSHRKKEIETLITKAVEYLENSQFSDGSWYGNWGICFTYGTFFALKGLAVTGKTYDNCAAIRKGVEFLLATQMEDGGWGESYLSCHKEKLVPLPKSNLVQTAWALMGLLHGGQANRDLSPLHRAEITGTSLKTCILNYPLYRNYFSLWALAEYIKIVPLPSTNSV